MRRLGLAYAFMVLASTPAFAGTGSIKVIDQAGATQTYNVITDINGHYAPETVICNGGALETCVTVGTYGTAPGAVPALNVNAYVTNANTNGIKTNAGSSPVVISSDEMPAAGSPSALNVMTIQGVAGMTPIATTISSSGAAFPVKLQDGSGNPITSSTRGLQQPLSVQVLDASGNQITSFGGSGTTGFPGTQSTGVPITASTGAGGTGTLPSGSVVVATNVGASNAAYCKLGSSATTSDQYIAPNGGWFAFTVGSASQLTCVTTASTTTVNMVGGSGLATGTGGGGGGSGGGAVGTYGTAPGAVPAQAVNAAVTNLTTGTYGTAPGAVPAVPVNAFVSNANSNGIKPNSGSAPVVISSDEMPAAGSPSTANVMTVQGVAGMTPVTTSVSNAVTAKLQDGSGNPITSSTRGAQQPLSVQVLDSSGNQITTFGGSTNGFPNTQSTGVPLSVTTLGVTGSLPTGTTVVATNVGTTNPAYCKLGASSSLNDQYISPNGGWFAFQVGASTQISCITGTGTTSVNLVGGSGLPTGTGGGGGGSGGGGGAIGVYGTSPGAVAAQSVNAFVTNIVPLGQTNNAGSTPVTLSTDQMKAAGSPSLTQILTVQGATGMTPVSTSLTNFAGGTLGAMANYGTSPGAVLVPGVNAFITNLNVNGKNTSALSAPVVLSSGQMLAAGSGSATDVMTVQGVAGMTPVSVNCVTGCSGSGGGGASSNFGAAFPTTGAGTPIGVLGSGGVNMTWLKADASQNLNVSIAGQGILNLDGQSNMANSAPVVIASDQTPVPTRISSQYPVNSIPVTSSTSGSSIISATLSGTTAKTTFICGFSERSNTSATTTGTLVITGTIGGPLDYMQWSPANGSGMGVIEEIFVPCIPASAQNTSIVVTTDDPGSGGAISVVAWGYQAVGNGY